MYEFIEGELAHKSPVAAVINAGGVGYRLTIPLSTYETLPLSGRVHLLVYLHVREEIMRLYGFATEKERALFLRLISVSGIGPTMAITALNGISVDDFRRAVAGEDVTTLCRIKGIGRKTAERIVVELKRDMEREIIEQRSEGMESSAAGTTTDAVAAMLALGYTRSVAENAVTKALARTGREAPLEQVIREALQQV